VPVITAEGIEIPTVELLLEQIAEEQRANIDPTLDTSPESPEGQMNGIFASHMREAWEVIALLFNLSPADAEDFMLDWISSLTGTFREGATRSTFRGVRSVSVNLEPGTSLPIGSEAHVLDKPDIRFRTTEEVENATASPADVLVEMESLDFGPIVANANTLTVIATPVLGWNSVTNPTDAEPGRLRESDAELRTKRERELRKPGTATVDAIAVDLESIEYEGETPVESAIVFQNTTSVTDARGLPPRSIEALVFDGVDASLPDNVIAQALWNSKAGGIKTHGNSAGVALDRNGASHTMRFSRPTIVPFAMYVEGTYDPLQYEGDESLAVAIADFMKGIAKSEMLVRFSKVIDAAHNVRGVTGITAVRFQAFDALPFVNYQMGLRQYPLFDSGDVLLTMTAG
jgi:hypothetical protein